MSQGTNGPVLVIEDLVKEFPIRAGVFRREVGTVSAVDGVNRVKFTYH